MMSRRVLGSLIGLSILVASLSGCSKKEDAPPVEEETAPESNVQAADSESPEQVVSGVMEQFLDGSAGSGSATVHDRIDQFFEFWGHTIRNHPRRPMDIHFEIELAETFQRDHTMKDKTNREFLDEVCQANGLVWTITGPDTIRISAKAK